MVKKKIVIIGAGTLGLFLGSQILKNKKKNFEVFFLEKGSEKNNFICKSDIGKSLYFKLGTKYLSNLGIGGLSKLWGGQLSEFDREDLKKRYWGINYAKLNNYYLKIYSIFNLSKSFFNKVKPNPIINNKETRFYFTRWLPQPNFFFLFKKILLDSRVKVIKEITDININFKKNRATEIIIQKNNQKNIQISCDYIVLCMGVFETIKFLLKNKKNSPWRLNKNIGAYFQDHYSLKVGEVKIYDPKRFNYFFFNRLISNQKVQTKIKYNNVNSLALSGEFKPSKNNYQSVMQKLIYSLKNRTKIDKKLFINFNLILEIKYLFFLIYYLLKKRIYFNYHKGMNFFLQCEQSPKKNNKVYLDNKNKIKVLWKCNNVDIFLIKKSLKKFDDYFKNFNFFKVNFDKFFRSKTNQIKKEISHTDHASGGTIISKNEQSGVVDNNLKIWNTKNVYICCSSVFPNSSHANIGLTSMAFALRLSERLKNKI